MSDVPTQPALSDALLKTVEHWMAHDPDPASRDELGALLQQVRGGDADAGKDLFERFVGPLAFGTAGLRGVLGAGESRMNRAVVLRTSYGLAQYIKRHGGEDAAKRGIAIGYDARRMSRIFAEDSAAVFAAAGVRAHLSPIECPTPVAAFAVDYLGAAAGVMVTASHNPPEYNGYKVYWSNGAQIIPPHDVGIAAEIDKAPTADAIARMDLDEARGKDLLAEFPGALEAAYVDAVLALRVRPDAPPQPDFPIVYTPLHGVGNRLTTMVLARAGFQSVHSVAEQAKPDGAFPTVRFPNPEEKGALDLSYALAERVKSDFIVANDPDVDRLAVAVRGPEGTFVQLTGNQVGVLLGHYLLTERSHQPTDKRLVLASCVSSPMLGAIAATMGVHYEETLTGFKWIANRAMELEKSDGLSFVFGYEEALGYTVGSLVRDKDGISAVLLIAELNAQLLSRKQTLFDRLNELAHEYGLYASRQVSINLAGSDGIAKIGEIMRTLRADRPTTIGAHKVVKLTDVQRGVVIDAAGQETKTPLPASDVLIYGLAGNNRIIARPSGTEPKIKFYFDVVEPLSPGESIADASPRADQKLDALSEAFCALAGVRP